MKKAVAEFTGTFLLVFCGTGAIVINESSNGAVTHPGIAAVFGLVVFALVMTFGAISGAHINPAVTLTQFVRRKLPAGDSLFFIAAQLTGATAAGFVLQLLFPASSTLGATLPAGSEGQSFVLEFLLTFFLMLAILRTAHAGASLTVIAAVAGAVVGLEALFAGPICGASMNPARSLGPALVSGHTEHLWLYLVAPVAGALTAAGFSRFFNSTSLSQFFQRK